MGRVTGPPEMIGSGWVRAVKQWVGSGIGSAEKQWVGSDPNFRTRWELWLAEFLLAPLMLGQPDRNDFAVCYCCLANIFILSFYNTVLSIVARGYNNNEPSQM